MESFSQTVRAEIVRSDLGTCSQCIKSELAAILHICGSIHLAGREKLALSVTLEFAAVARRVIKLLKASYNPKIEIRMEQVEWLGKHHRYLVYLPVQAGLVDFLQELGMLDRDNIIDRSIPSELVQNKCCQASFIRGAFLAGGSISDPRKGTYHLEIVTSNGEFANGLVYLMNLMRLKAKLGHRKGQFLVYLKESEAIARVLSLINAYQGVIKLEEVRVIKGLRGEVNRRVNCETANLERVLTSAWQQVQEIEALIANNAFSELSPKLQTTAQLRLDYPQASLKELADAHHPPVSKSAVNHRLREISRLAEKFVINAGNQE